jgi:hypothetical protein
MQASTEQLLKIIGKQTVMIEYLQAQLKEAQARDPEQNGSGTYHEQAPWAKATAPSEASEVR